MNTSQEGVTNVANGCWHSNWTSMAQTAFVKNSSTDRYRCCPQSTVRSNTPLLMHLLVLQLLDKGLPGLPIGKVLWKGSAVCKRSRAAPWGLSRLDRRGQVA